jgi:hypothetical protein
MGVMLLARNTGMPLVVGGIVPLTKVAKPSRAFAE